MTKLLLKLFIKDYEQVDSQSVRTSYGVVASIVGVACNVILFLIKVSIGYFINSITVIADSFNNLSDAASSIIGFVGVKMANRPADKEHPFGHGRAEYVAALVVAFLVIMVSISCFKGAFLKILHPEILDFQPILVLILALSISIKIWLSIFNKKLGKIVNSKVMLATSADARGDVFITSATVASILVGHFTGLAIDGYAGVVVSIFVFISGINIAKDTLEPILGEAIDRGLYRTITEKVESYEGIQGSHDLIVHMYGPTHRMASIHAEIPNDITLDEAHEIIDKIERDVLKELGVFLVIHIDPVKMDSELIPQLKIELLNLLQKLESKAKIHDFRVVEEQNQTSIYFDLVVPYSYSKDEENNLMLSIIQAMRNENPKYQCIITCEKSFVSEEE